MALLAFIPALNAADRLDIDVKRLDATIKTAGQLYDRNFDAAS